MYSRSRSNLTDWITSAARLRRLLNAADGI